MGRSRVLFALAVVLALAIRSTLPSGPGHPWLSVLWLSTVMAVSVAAMARGVRRNRPEPGRRWGLLVTGIGLYSFGAIVAMVGRAAGASFSGILLLVVVAATLLSFVLMGVGIVYVLGVRDTRLDWGVGLDAAMIATAFGYFVWELVFAGRYTPNPVESALVYGNVLLASIVGAVCLRTGTLAKRPAPSYWLIAAALIFGTSGTIIRATSAAGGWDATVPVSMAMGLTWMFAAAAALHPSMRDPIQGTRDPSAVSLPRMWIAAGALLAIPIVALHALQGLRGGIHTTQSMVVTGLLSILAIIRVARALVGHQRALADSERNSARFRSLIQHAHDPVAIVDRRGVVVYASPAVRGVTGFGPQTYEGSILTQHVHDDDVLLTAEHLAETVHAAERTVFEFRMQHHLGGFRWLEVVAADHSDEEHVAGIVLNMRDITDRKAAESELSRLALYDPLTGLPNRTLLADRLRQALARSRRTNSTVSVVFLDLDRFKVVNDSLGHNAGDRLLVAAATRLRASLRDSTTLARFGGDEFVALCEDLEREEHAVDVAERMLAALAEGFSLGDTAVHMGGSIGIAYGSGDDTPESLVRDADAAMYLAKARGSGSIEIFNSEMRHNALARLELESDLRRALDRNELRLLYQPIVRLSDGCVSGVEALVRWEHPERGLLSPDAFIPLAEDTGLIVPLGDWVLEEACRQVRVWDASMPEVLAVSVNLSAIQLGVSRSGMPPVPQAPCANGRTQRQESFVQRLRDILERHGVAPGRLNLEITESVLMDGEGAAAALQALKDVGVHVAVDDFGTGYSGLSYLKRLPADMMKIDRSFLTGIAEDRSDRALVETMIGLGHSFNLCVVAEGVETIEQLVVLAALGCDYAQGYLIARPMTGEELIRRYVAREEPFAALDEGSCDGGDDGEMEGVDAIDGIPEVHQLEPAAPPALPIPQS